MNAPCKDCEKRKVGCHSDCPAYLEFKEKIEARAKEERLKNLYPTHNNFGVPWEKYQKQWRKSITKDS